MLSEANRSSREERKAETRLRLLEAAAQVFARRGYHAATVDEVATEAGFTIGALYAHFGSKKELFLAILREHVAIRMADYSQAIAAGGSLEERVRAATDNWMAFIDTHPEFFPLVFEFRMAAVRDDELRPELTAAFSAMRAGIGELIRAGAADIGIALSEEEVAHLATTINALGVGLALERSTDPQGVPTRLFADAVLELIGAIAARRTN